MSKSYWNPYTRDTLTHYQDTWHKALAWQGKNVEVTKENGQVITGCLTNISACANGGLGLYVTRCGIDQWVGPEFTEIKNEI